MNGNDISALGLGLESPWQIDEVDALYLCSDTVAARSLSLAGCRESYEEATETILQVVTDRYRRLTLDDTCSCRVRDPVIGDREEELAQGPAVL